MKAVSIGDRSIGPGNPCFIIAEVGVNHNGEVETAKQLIDAAAEAGTDAVKFQTFRADRLTVDRDEREMLRRLELSESAFSELAAYCHDRGVQFLSTPFDEESVDFLQGLGVPAFKVGSGEVTHLPLLAHIARKGKPVLLSTGMATLAEVHDAVQVLKREENEDLVLLHCVSRYPAPPKEANLRAMATLTDTFDVPVGFSDHTLGIEVSLAAVALGASVIERHLTLDRSMPGPDHRASLEPTALEEVIRSIRQIEDALGDGAKEPQPSERETRVRARRSIVARADIPLGTVLDPSHLAIKRPGTGIPPRELEAIIGKRLRVDVPEDTLLTWEMVH